MTKYPEVCRHGYLEKCPTCREDRECAEDRAHLARLNAEIAILKAANQEMAHRVNDMDAERKGYLAAIRERNAEIVGLRSELNEQCRLLGISGSVEAKLRAENQKMHHDWMAEHAELENMKEDYHRAREAAGRSYIDGSPKDTATLRAYFNPQPSQTEREGGDG